MWQGIGPLLVYTQFQCFLIKLVKIACGKPSPCDRHARKTAAPIDSV
jgi:hypothetical protein